MIEENMKLQRLLAIVAILTLAVIQVFGPGASASGLERLAVQKPASEQNMVTQPAGTVNLVLSPASRTAQVGDIVAFDMQVAAGTQPVNNVELYVDFDPVVLGVVDAAGNPATAIEPDLSTLNTELFNTANNSGGHIRYDAGKLTGAPPTGTFRVALLRFKVLKAVSSTTVRFAAPSNVFYQGTSVLGTLGSANVLNSATACPTGTVSTPNGCATITPTPTNTPTRTPTPTLTGTVTPPLSKATMRLDTTPLSGSIGATFSTKIFADNIPIPGLGAWQAKIDYNPAVVRVKSIAWGTDLFSTGNAKLTELVSPSTFPSATGSLLLSQATLPTVNGPTGSGILLATVQFEAIGNGTSTLTLIAGTGGSYLRNTSNSNITPLDLVNSSVTVTSSPTSKVNLVFSPASRSAQVGDIIAFDMQAAAGTQPVNNVELYVDFDPSVLQVVNANGSPAAGIEADLATLNTQLVNTVDNTGGHIRYDAGKLSGAAPTGTFRIAILRFKVTKATPSTTVRFVSPSNVFYQGASVVGTLGSANVQGATARSLLHPSEECESERRRQRQRQSGAELQQRHAVHLRHAGDAHRQPQQRLFLQQLERRR